MVPVPLQPIPLALHIAQIILAAPSMTRKIVHHPLFFERQFYSVHGRLGSRKFLLEYSTFELHLSSHPTVLKAHVYSFEPSFLLSAPIDSYPLRALYTLLYFSKFKALHPTSFGMPLFSSNSWIWFSSSTIKLLPSAIFWTGFLMSNTDSFDMEESSPERDFDVDEKLVKATLRQRDSDLLYTHPQLFPSLQWTWNTILHIEPISLSSRSSQV